MSARDERAISILLEAAGRYISREAGRGTLITPTRATLSSDRKNATIYVSVFPEGQDAKAIEFLMRHKDLFRNDLKKTTRFSRLPFIRFEIDRGEKARQHLEDVTRGLEIPEEDA
ncbi:MAG TPA: ribosome-binding factor A [Candidatus Paceibacterota bacterium]|nr:ribosome-binding factor A [Candidatus Paceibacterota bacterium]